jgi:hypothetical protein
MLGLRLVFACFPLSCFIHAPFMIDIPCPVLHSEILPATDGMTGFNPMVFTIDGLLRASPINKLDGPERIT